MKQFIFVYKGSDFLKRLIANQVLTTEYILEHENDLENLSVMDDYSQIDVNKINNAKTKERIQYFIKLKQAIKAKDVDTVIDCLEKKETTAKTVNEIFNIFTEIPVYCHELFFSDNFCKYIDFDTLIEQENVIDWYTLLYKRHFSDNEVKKLLNSVTDRSFWKYIINGSENKNDFCKHLTVPKKHKKCKKV